MKPAVYFSCATCGWRRDVPDEHVVLVDGLPRSAVVILHEGCTGEPDVTERGCFDAELVTAAPMQHFKITL